MPFPWCSPSQGKNWHARKFPSRLQCSAPFTASPLPLVHPTRASLASWLLLDYPQACFYLRAFAISSASNACSSAKDPSGCFSHFFLGPCLNVYPSERSSLMVPHEIATSTPYGCSCPYFLANFLHETCHFTCLSSFFNWM